MKSKLLSILISFSAIAAIVAEVYTHTSYGILKGLTTLFIILIVTLNDWKNDAYTRYVLIGLIFCLLGDLFLVKATYFVFGLSSFLIGHSLFLLAFNRKSKGFFDANVFIPLLLIGTAYYGYLYPDLGNMKLPVAIYFSVIISMVWKATSLYLQKSHTKTMLGMLGALLFLVSDAILGWDKFHNAIPYAGVYILSTYWTGIYLIAISTKALKAKVYTNLVKL